MGKVKGMRWWMVGMVTAGLIVNYLARNTLSVAAPTMMHDLHMTTKEYSYVVVAWQACYALMQPVAGYILDAIGTKNWVCDICMRVVNCLRRRRFCG